MTDIEPEYMSQREAAQLLGISARTLRNWVAAGVVAPRKFPGRARPRYAVVDLHALAKKEEQVSG